MWHSTTPLVNLQPTTAPRISIPLDKVSSHQQAPPATLLCHMQTTSLNTLQESRLATQQVDSLSTQDITALAHSLPILHLRTIFLHQIKQVEPAVLYIHHPHSLLAHIPLRQPHTRHHQLGPITQGILRQIHQSVHKQPQELPFRLHPSLLH